MSLRLRLIAVLVAAASISWSALPASAARKSTVTNVKFKLASYEVASGDDVTGSVNVRTRSGKRWVPLAGATLAVYVDGVQVGSVTTDESGNATVEHTTDSLGEHTVKVAYAGDATHKKARRAQGFDVTGTFFRDADGDGFGDAADSVVATAQPAGYVEDGSDCDDTSGSVNPGAVEDTANGIDDNCDGQVDDIS